MEKSLLNRYRIEKIIILHWLYFVFLNYFQLGAKTFRRLPALNDHPIFIEALVDLVSTHLKEGPRLSPQLTSRCPDCVNETCGKVKNWFSNLCNWNCFFSFLFIKKKNLLNAIIQLLAKQELLYFIYPNCIYSFTDHNKWFPVG